MTDLSSGPRTALLQDDLQTATPVFLEPHPAFIDHLDLPPHYLPADVDVDDLPEITQPKLKAAPAETPVEPSPAPVSQAAAAEPLEADEVFLAPEESKDQEMENLEDEETTSVAASDSASAAVASTTQSASATPRASEGPEAAAGASADTASRRAAKSNKRARQDDDAYQPDKAVKHKRLGERTVAPPAGEEPPLGPPVEYVLQSTTCLSKKVDGQVRCWQCIARSIGHGCSFMGIRSFGVDRLGRIVTPPVFRSATEPDEVPNLDKPYTSPMTKAQSTLLKTWLARDLMKLFEREWKHAADPDTIKIRNDLVTHSTCDTCNTACVGAEWICKTCGRTACPLCFERLRHFEAIEANGGAVMPTADNQRRRKCIAKKRGKEQTGGEPHRPHQFMAVTRLDASKLERMRQVARSWHLAHKLQASDPKVVQYIMQHFCLPSNLREYDANTHRVWTIAHKVFDEAFFFEVWRRGEPLLVRRCPPGALDKWTPEYFATSGSTSWTSSRSSTTASPTIPSTTASETSLRA